MQHGISIIISAYKTSQYIDECLASIYNQTYFKTHDNFEILLGIDNCEETLAKVRKIKHKYPKMNVYMMNENVGTYVVCNTMIVLAKYDWILRFDSDDVMMPHMVETLVKESNDVDYIRYQLKNFTDGVPLDRGEIQFSHGSAFYRRETFIKLGGYQPYLCGADTDFFNRMRKCYKIKYLEQPLYNRRLRQGALTTRPDTGFKSEYRKRIFQVIQNPKTYDTKEKCVIKQITTTGYKRIDAPFGISVCITAYNVADYIEECLDSVAKQTFFVDHNDYEILLGIDGCQKTLEKVKQIQHKYRNLSVYMMEKNVGTYITTNTIMSKARYGWLLRFDSDDIMLPGMVETLMKYRNDCDRMRPYAVNFGLKDNALRDRHGCIMLRKKIFDEYGGYQPWICAADGELQARLENFVTTKIVETVVFRRRLHGENLTWKKETNLKSEIRKKYHELIHTPTNKKEAIIKCVTAPCKEIRLDYKRQPIVSLTTYPARYNAVPEVIWRMRSQTMQPAKIVVCFAAKDFLQITNDIRRMIVAGVIEVIITTDDLRTHNKYFYTMKKYRKNPIVTVDDDRLYEDDTVETLFNNYLNHPDVVSAHRVHQITKDDKGTIKPYKEWRFKCTDIKTPSKELLATGVGGVLYPPDILKVSDSWTEYMHKYITVDDIVLKYFENQLCIDVMFVKSKQLLPKGIEGTEKQALYLGENISKNDIAINELLK